MTRYAWTAAVVILMLAAAAAVAQPLTEQDKASRWPAVTVIDVSRWTHRDVTLFWTEDGEYLVVVRADGAEKPFRPEEIERVLDRDGRDITQLVAGARPVRKGGAVPGIDPGIEAALDPPAEPEEGWDTGEQVPYSELQDPRSREGSLAYLLDPPLFGYAFDAGVGYSTTTGDWFQGLDDGINLQLGLRTDIGARKTIHFVFRHRDLGSQQITVYGYDEFPETFEVDSSLNEFLFLFGAYGKPRTGSKSRSVGYFESGMGVHSYRVSLGGRSESETKLVFAIQGGVWIDIGDRTMIDLGVNVAAKPDWDDMPGGTAMGLHCALMVTD